MDIRLSDLYYNSSLKNTPIEIYITANFINKSGNSNLKKLPIKFLEREILKKIVFKKNYTNFEKDKNENKDL